MKMEAFDKDSMYLVLEKIPHVKSMKYKDIINLKLHFRLNDLDELVTKLANIGSVLEEDDESYHTILERKLLEFQDDFIQACMSIYPELFIPPQILI